MEVLTIPASEIAVGDALDNDIDNSHWIVSAVDGDDLVLVSTHQAPWPFEIPADATVTVNRGG